MEVGKYADLAIFDVEDYSELPYYFSVDDDVMKIMPGEIVFPREGF